MFHLPTQILYHFARHICRVTCRAHCCGETAKILQVFLNEWKVISDGLHGAVKYGILSGMKTNSTAISALVALALTGCNIDSRTKVIRPADRPVAEVSAIAAMKGEQLTEKCSFEKDGYTLLYRRHSPKCEPGVKYPLVLFLHGAGERGNDNTATLVHGVVPICRYAMRHGDAFVVAPQCPSGRKWVDQDWSTQSMRRPETPSAEMAAVMALMRELVATLPVDPTRVYVTGISMGGFGTWDIASRMPGFFAAAMPICGGVDETTAELYRGLPLRFFHGSVDGAVPVVYSRRMDKALADAGIEHGYTEYANVNHDCWTRTYANDDVLAWLFAQIRGR